MSKEAMKLALEALKRMKRYGNTFGYRSHEQNPYEQVCEAITALREALAEQPAPATELREQEPVAFLVDGDLYYPEEIDWETLQEQGHTVAALYTSPPAQQEPVNKYCCHLCFNKSGQIFMDRMILCPECGNKRCPKATHHGLPCTKSNDVGQRGSIYDQPPQRTWVGLTNKDVYECEPKKDWYDSVEFARAIEAKLKEKNI